MKLLTAALLATTVTTACTFESYLKVNGQDLAEVVEKTLADRDVSVDVSCPEAIMREGEVVTCEVELESGSVFHADVRFKDSEGNLSILHPTILLALKLDATIAEVAGQLDEVSKTTHCRKPVRAGAAVRCRTTLAAGGGLPLDISLDGQRINIKTPPALLDVKTVAKKVGSMTTERVTVTCAERYFVADTGTRLGCSVRSADDRTATVVITGADSLAGVTFELVR